MQSELCGALLFIACLIVVLLGVLISIGRSIDTSPQARADEYLEIQKERNEILREQLRVQQMQAEMQYIALKQREKEEAPPTAQEQVELPKIPLLKHGEAYRYTKELRPRQMDNFPDDPEFQKRQAEQDARIERLRH